MYFSQNKHYLDHITWNNRAGLGGATTIQLAPGLEKKWTDNSSVREKKKNKQQQQQQYNKGRETLALQST